MGEKYKYIYFIILVNYFQLDYENKPPYCTMEIYNFEKDSVLHQENVRPFKRTCVEKNTKLERERDTITLEALIMTRLGSSAGLWKTRFKSLLSFR